MFHQARDFVQVPAPFLARPDHIHQGQPDGERDRDIAEANQEEARAAARFDLHAEEGIENREEDERHGQRLEQPDDEEPELAEVVVAQTGEDRAGVEDHPEENPARHAESGRGRTDGKCQRPLTLRAPRDKASSVRPQTASSRRTSAAAPSPNCGTLRLSPASREIHPPASGSAAIMRSAIGSIT